jgi:HK97 family phage portal protein
MGALAGRRERRQWLPEPVVPPFLGAATTGYSNVAARPDSALVVPAVWACVQLLAGTVSMMPLRTFRTTPTVPAKINDPAVVSNPAAGMTQSEWLHMLMVSLLLRGNAYGLKTTLDGMARATQVELLNPDTVHVDVQDGAVKYLLGPERVNVTDRMWHVRGFTLPGAKVGLSPIEAAAMAIGVDLASRRFGRDFFEGGGVPKATLTSDQTLTPDQAREAKERMLLATANRDPLVLGSGLTYTPISLRPDESQFLETQQANISEIARFFGIPAEMVGGKTGSSLTYANVEQRSLDFLTYGVAFWLKRVEDAFFDLLPQPQFVKFDTGALLRTDAETQAKVRVQYVAGKVLPPSRILQEMGEPPLTEDEKAELELVPLTVTATGMPRVNPTASSSGASDSPNLAGPAPAPTTKPKLEAVHG